MKLFVTGGAGFIGSNFILYWLNHYPDDSIINFDKLTYAGNLENLISIEGDRRYRFVKGDICDTESVSRGLEGCDIIVHFAAESHVDRSIIDPTEFIKTNINGTHILLDAALSEGVRRFHHISTDEVFGSLDLSDRKKFSENTPYKPRSPYAASKAASDHLVMAYYHTYNLPVTISNCSNNFGPYQFPEKFIPLTVINLLCGRKVPIYGDGLNVRDWIYVDDHCQALDLIIRKGLIGETYCVGGMDKDVNNLSIVRRILKIMGKNESDIEFIKDRPGHDRKYAIDFSKISRTLGWKPEFDLDYYLVKTVKWYQENRPWWEKILSGNYRSYYQMHYGEST